MGHTRTYTTLGVEVVGFGLVIALFAMNELVDLPHLLFGAPRTPIRVSEIVLEVGAALIVAAAVVAMSWRANQRVARLEHLLLMCGSCQRICVDGRWLAFEEYVNQHDRLKTTHGVCPTCYESLMGDYGVNPSDVVPA